MCGITGAMQFGAPNNVAYNQSALYLITALLKGSEARGKDATGIAALFEDGNFLVQKMAISATEFVGRSGGKPDDYEGLLAFLRNYEPAALRCIIGHCRKKSVGALNNTDNHPIKAGNILGVHNGTLKNDAEIIENLACERDGSVDSEAIFRLFEFFTNDCKDPFTLESVGEVCKRLEGTFSFLAVNANNPYQVVSARDGRPAEYCLIKPLNMVLVSSEKKFIDLALYSYNELARLFPTGNERTAFVKLKLTDVEHGTLPDNTLALFDLTKEITPETKLADLYTTGKIPFTVDRLWKSAVTTTYTGNNYCANKTKPVNTVAEDKKSIAESTGTTKTPETRTTSTGSTGSAKTPTGRVWNASLNTFVRDFGKKNLVDDGLVIDTERKTAMVLTAAHSTAISDNTERRQITSEVKKTADTLETGLKCVNTNYPVEEYSTGEVVKFEDLSPTGTQTASKQEQAYDAGKAIVVMKEGIEKGKQIVAGEIGAREAVVAAAKKLEKFKDDAEVAEFLDIDVLVLGDIPVVALANRLIKKLFGTYFVEGWQTCYKSTQANNNDTTSKISKAEEYVRVLKTLQLGIIKKATPATEANLNLVAETARNLAETGRISKEVMQEIFSVGDLRESEVLRRIIAVL